VIAENVLIGWCRSDSSYSQWFYPGLSICQFYLRLSAEFSPLQTAEQPADTWRCVSTDSVRTDCRCRKYIFLRIVRVSLICLPVIIYPLLWRYIADIGVCGLAAPGKKRLPTCLAVDFISPQWMWNCCYWVGFV